METMSKKEWLLFAVTVLAFSMIGATEGIAGFLVFGGMGLIIWIIWRGRKL